jgi:hypothetical protein
MGCALIEIAPDGTNGDRERSTTRCAAHEAIAQDAVLSGPVAAARGPDIPLPGGAGALHQRGLEERRKLLGDFEMNVAFRFGGTPYEVSERGLKLFAKEVLPVVKSWKSEPAKAAE